MKDLFHEIPVLDISSLDEMSDSLALSTLAKKLFFIYSKIGFAYIVNHSIPQRLFDDVFEQSKLFHALPENDKIKIRQNEFFRGYMPLATSSFKISTLGQAKKPNLSSAFILAHEVEEDSSDYQLGINLAGPNQWPNNTLLPNFKETLLSYRDALTSLARKLVRLFALALGQDYHSFDRYFEHPTTFLRLQYYPQRGDKTESDGYGIAPHTDYGFLTLLVQDGVGGLQVLRQDGGWIDVTPLPGGIILNTGDMLKYISNNKIISTPHRVINTSVCDRYSVPFFLEPDMHALISPIKASGDSSFDKPSFEYAEYLMARIKGNYDINAADKNDLSK